MVDELLRLWKGVQMETPCRMFPTKIIRAALVYISSDLSATRKVCGFYAVNALHGCSKCLKTFPYANLQADYSGFDRSSWKSRNKSEHIEQASRAKSAPRISSMPPY